MKTGLLLFGLLFCLTFSVDAAFAQQAGQIVPPPPGGATPYVVPPQVPVGAAPMMQMPPPGYGAPDPNQPWPPQGYPPQQFAQWGPPPGGQPPPGPDAGQVAPPQGYGYPPPQGYPPQYGAPTTPPQMSRYEQQEAALRESQMVDQLEDVKQQKEMEESFRHGVLAEFEDGKNGTASSGFNGDQSKVKTGAKKAGNALKTGMKMCAPTASYIGTFFILRGLTGGF